MGDRFFYSKKIEGLKKDTLCQVYLNMAQWC